METNNLVSEIVFISRNIPGFKFRIAEAKIYESLDYPYHIECICYYEGINNEPFKNGIYGILDMNVRVYLNDPSYTNMKEKQKVTKLFKGVIKEAVYLGDKEFSGNFTKEHRHYYKMIIASQMIRLNYNKAYRIYNDKSVLDVLQKVYENAKNTIATQFDFSRIQNSFKKEEYISQYNESDLEFLLRLCSNYGIYFVENEDGVFFYDSVQKADFDLKNNKLNLLEVSKHHTYPYNPSSDNYLTSLCISHIESGMEMGNQWSFFSSGSAGNPHIDEVYKSQNYWDDRGIDNRDKITNYAVHKDLTNITFNEDSFQNGLQFQANINLLSRHIERTRIKAKSNILNININDVLTVIKPEGNYTYRVTGIIHYYHDKSEQGGRILEKEPALYSMYSNELRLIPNTMPYTMKYIDKPRVFGVTLGVVIGEKDSIDDERNNIVVDEYGRVRVRFSSMAVQGQYDEDGIVDNDKYTHSCYLRYASPAASSSSGFIAVPRVGDEVIISYIDGDPNRPIITGSLYNLSNKSLIQNEILQNKHKTSLSSKTVGKGQQGVNEFTMSNIPEKQEIYLKAERNYKELVKHNYEQTIENDKTTKVIGFFTEEINQEYKQHVTATKNIKIDGKEVIAVGLSKETEVLQSNTLNVGSENILKVAKNSRETIGGNKNLDIEKDYLINVYEEKKETIHGNEHKHVKGSYNVSSDTCISVFSDNSYNVEAGSDLELYSKNNTSINTDNHLSICAKTSDIQFKDNVDIISENTISFNTGKSLLINVKDEIQASISSDGFSFKVKDIELLISSDGISIKGGKLEIKK